MKPMKPLSEIIPDWPASAPTSGVELRRTDYDALRDQLVEAGASDQQVETVLAVRKHLVVAALSASEPAALSVESAKAMIESHFLYPMARKWVTYPLRKDRTRVIAARQGGGADAVKAISRRIPTAEHLHDVAPLPEKGVYLMLYGGDPGILSLSDSHGRRAEDDLHDLFAAVPVVDVLFRLLEKDRPTTLYSLRAGLGEQTGQQIQFPDSAVMERLRSTLLTSR